MRDAYVGDITDLLKFSLLRELAGSDRRLGVAWYFLQGRDNDVDGRHLEWCEQRHWKLFDPTIHTWLRPIALSNRKVSALENGTFGQQTTYFSNVVPNGLDRPDWLRDKKEKLDHCDLIFLDPDNGIGNHSKKHATVEEIRSLHRNNRAVICISFPHFGKPHAEQLERLQNLLHAATGSPKIATIRTNVSLPGKRPNMTVPRARWFTVVGCDVVLRERMERFCKRLNSTHRASAEIHLWQPSKA